MPDKDKVAVIGTGIMGFHMAHRLAEGGFSVSAWNRTPEKAEPLKAYGVDVVTTAEDAAKDVDTAVLMVSDGPATDEVIFGVEGGGLLNVMKPGATILVMSSIPVETALRQGEATKEKGLSYLDAPVSGGEPGARDGTLAIMAGGDREAFDRLHAVFSIFGRATYVGGAGAGSLAKLANQMIVGNTIATVAEALILAEQGGADPQGVIDALTGGFADSVILQNHGRRMIKGDFNPGGPVRLQLKDLRTAMAFGESRDLTLPMTSQARDIFETLAQAGHENLDHAAAYLELKHRNKLE